MRALKFPTLLRRKPDRPTLKQRAAALKATAARVMKRKPAPADRAIPFEGIPFPPGFIPYPFDAPQSFFHVSGALKAEGERLLRIATREMDRRLDDAEHRLSENEKRSHETLIRRTLRIDALMSLAGRMDPSNKPLPEPGSAEAVAAFHVACGETDRLSHVAIHGYPELDCPDGTSRCKGDLSRDLESGAITPATFARLYPLAAERERRIEAARIATNIDALFVLAFANDYPVPMSNAAGGDPDHAATEPHDPDAVPADLAAACAWAVRHVDWINTATDVRWTDDRGTAEMDKVRAVMARAIAEPTHDLAALAGMASLFLQDTLNETPDLEEQGGLYERLEIRIMRGLIALARPAARACPDLSKCSVKQLTTLHATLTRVWEHLTGEQQSPWCWDGQRENYNAAGKVVDTIAERLAGTVEEIRLTIERRQPVDDEERDERLSFLLRDALSWGTRPESAVFAEAVAVWGVPAHG